MSQRSKHGIGQGPILRCPVVAGYPLSPTGGCSSRRPSCRECRKRLSPVLSLHQSAFDILFVYCRQRYWPTCSPLCCCQPTGNNIVSLPQSALTCATSVLLCGSYLGEPCNQRGNTNRWRCSNSITRKRGYFLCSKIKVYEIHC